MHTLSPLSSALLDLIEDEAAAARPASSNLDYAFTLDTEGAHVVRTLRALAAAGLIIAQTNGQGGRRFWACRLDAWTGCSTRKNGARTAGRVRPCLSCSTNFPSEGIGNRLCPACIRRDGPPDPLWIDSARARELTRRRNLVRHAPLQMADRP